MLSHLTYYNCSSRFLKQCCILLKLLEIQDDIPFPLMGWDNFNFFSRTTACEISRGTRNVPVKSTRSVVVFRAIRNPTWLKKNLNFFPHSCFIWSLQTCHSVLKKCYFLELLEIQDGHLDLWLANTCFTSVPEKNACYGSRHSRSVRINYKYIYIWCFFYDFLLLLLLLLNTG